MVKGLLQGGVQQRAGLSSARATHPWQQLNPGPSGDTHSATWGTLTAQPQRDPGSQSSRRVSMEGTLLRALAVPFWDLASRNLCLNQAKLGARLATAGECVGLQERKSHFWYQQQQRLAWKRKAPAGPGI